MDSLHRFSIERLTSNSSGDKSDNWNGTHTSHIGGHKSGNWNGTHTSHIGGNKSDNWNATHTSHIGGDKSDCWNSSMLNWPSYFGSRQHQILPSQHQVGNVKSHHQGDKLVQGHSGSSSQVKAAENGGLLNRSLDQQCSMDSTGYNQMRLKREQCEDKVKPGVCTTIVNPIQSEGANMTSHCQPLKSQTTGSHPESILDQTINGGQNNDDINSDSCSEPGDGIHSNNNMASTQQDKDDPNEKPQHSYIALISEAILSYPEKKLVLSDIYQYIMDKYPYYNNQERAWRNSIRHNLSLNECFIKAGRAENGKGNYWAIHPACMEDFSKGDYRRRHARRRARGGPYGDVNVSGLPYNYRCNIGYVPMTPAPSFTYPYHLPYLHTLSHRPTTNSILRGITSDDVTLRGIPSNDVTHIQSTNHKRSDTTTSMFVPKEVNKQEVKPSLPGMTGAATFQQNKNTNILPHSYIPSMLSQSFRYSPYGFPFF